MFVVTLRYDVALDRIDEALAEHIAWLDKNYADGTFVLSGPQVPRIGGVLIAVNTTREELDQRLADDPFNRRGYATYVVAEYAPTRVASGLEPLED